MSSALRNSSTPVAPTASGGRSRGHIPGELGVWFFILGDMFVFAWFFIVFMHQRGEKAAVFDDAHQSLSLTFGGLNTLLLLTGSWFVVLGLNALRNQRQQSGSRFIAATFLCGVAFVVNKALEWRHEIVIGHPAEQADFFMYYFILTGIHLLHLLIGLVVLIIMWRVARRAELQSKNFRTLEAGASYWHLVDLLWLVLFALFYLISG